MSYPIASLELTRKLPQQQEKIMRPQLIDVINLSKKHCKFPIQGHLVYATTENFLGRMVDGYHKNAAHLCLMTPRSAKALCEVQNTLNALQLGLFIFDTFRPLRAVRDFKKWMHHPVKNDYELERKKIHYPHIEKNQLAVLGYIADDVSNHCFGDTVDLSIVDLNSNELIDMGACFDYLDEISHLTAPTEKIGQQAFNNRQILLNAMQKHDFIPYEKEFWHFTYKERDISIPLDFEIELEAIEKMSAEGFA